MADQPRMQTQDKPFKIKPPLPSQEAAAALRAELEIELQNKKQCAYVPYECTQLTLDGYKYCLKHILQDKTAPFRECSYIYTTNNKRCHLPARKGDKKDFGYCTDHALKATLARNRQNSKYPPPKTAEVLLHSLAHYVKKPRNRTTSSSSHYQSDEGERNVSEESSGELKVTKSLDPFTEIDANEVYNYNCNEVLDFCSESESDVEASTFASVWHDSQADTSDDESIDSEQEDVLKHANVYTAEEITLVTRDKLIRLQSLYIEQYRHLQYILKEKRRKYLHALKREKETCCNIYSQVRDNPKEQRLYKKLKAYNKYQKSHGTEAIIHKRLHDLRAKITEGMTPKSQNYSKCTFTEGGVKCGERSLPLARHCRKHILEDSNQVLFKACGRVKADVECYTPVEAIFEDSTCRLHQDIPLLRSYSQARKDSESDMDESLESSIMLPDALTENIKTELIDYNLPPEIPKMETVPSLLFEESPHSLHSQATTITENPSDYISQHEPMELKHQITEADLLHGPKLEKLEMALEENMKLSQQENDLKMIQYDDSQPNVVPEECISNTENSIQMNDDMVGEIETCASKTGEAVVLTEAPQSDLTEASSQSETVDCSMSDASTIKTDTKISEENILPTSDEKMEED